MKFEKGMYIRTTCGITQIKEITKNFIEFDRNVVPSCECMTNECLKDDVQEWVDIVGEPSFKPIDLIEVGDYVNDYKVLEICEGNFEINNPLNVKSIKLELVKEDINPKIPFFKRYTFIINKDIKSIVTKEQFEQMSYKIGE